MSKPDIRKKNQVIILGSGTSSGVPTVGCKCAVCQSKDVKDKRLRTSIFLKTNNGAQILVDTSPDLRTQLLNNKINQVDAAIITHEHADHLHGIDDLRPLTFFSKKEVPIYASHITSDLLHSRFPYIFQPLRYQHTGTSFPLLKLEVLNPPQKISILKNDFEFFLLPHGRTKTLAFIHQKLGYIIDCESVDDKTCEKFRKRNLDLLLIDCVRYTPHETHLHLEKSLLYAQKIQAKRTGFIHLSHVFMHSKFKKELSKIDRSFFPAFDQQKITY